MDLLGTLKIGFPARIGARGNYLQHVSPKSELRGPNSEKFRTTLAPDIGPLPGDAAPALSGRPIELTSKSKVFAALGARSSVWAGDAGDGLKQYW